MQIGLELYAKNMKAEGLPMPEAKVEILEIEV
jgi:hypothetical protein